MTPAPKATVPGTLWVGASDFGWGSLGKLTLILDEMPDVEAVLHPNSAETGVLVSMPPRSAPDGLRPTAALVVNDPSLADEIAASGVPVIYVDSLPYLRHSEAELPKHALVFCAQKWPGQPAELVGPLAGLTHIQWIDPIVPRSSRRVGGRGTVLSVGGLRSHLSGDAPIAYIDKVLIPAAEYLSAAGEPVAAICGNLPDWACTRLRAIVPAAAQIGPTDTRAFHALLRHADRLITSPGSTTMLQAASMALPTVLLPPQNLSQFLNAEIFTSGSEGIAQWPTEVIDRKRVDELRAGGEDAAIDYVYRQVAGLLHSEHDALSVRQAVIGAIEAAPPGGVLSADLRSETMRGAGQVARIVRQTLLAPPLASPTEEFSR